MKGSNQIVTSDSVMI